MANSKVRGILRTLWKSYGVVGISAQEGSPPLMRVFEAEIGPLDWAVWQVGSGDVLHVLEFNLSYQEDGEGVEETYRVLVTSSKSPAEVRKISGLLLDVVEAL